MSEFASRFVLVIERHASFRRWESSAMYHFKIIPHDCPEEAVSLPDTEVTSALAAADRMASRMMHVHRDGNYAFSFVKLGRAAPYWIIFQRDS